MSIENYINDNRDAFDDEEMKIDWESIRAGMAQKKIRHRGRMISWLAAATVTICFFIGALLVVKNESGKATAMEPAVELPSKELTDQVDPAYTLQMDQFAILIQNRQSELSRNRVSQPELYRQFLQDNNHLDSSYNYLKKELAVNPNKEILLDAMIQNLQLKLDLLNRQLQIIKQSKNKKPNNESKTI